MPGRPPNHDKRIADLLKQLRAALVARESAQIARTVDAQMNGLVAGISKGVGGAAPTKVVAPKMAPEAGRGNRKPRSAASRAAQSRKMKAYWAAKRKAAASQSKGGKAKKKAAPVSTPQAAKG
jgi:hypothetical protein